MSHPSLEDFLETHPRFMKKRKLLLLSELVYQPTSEKVTEGFRYFACAMSAVTQALEGRDFSTLEKLPFALDDDGDADTSAVRLDVAYTDSGSVVAAQPVEYKEHVPTPVAPVLLLEGDEARRLFASVKALDQSS